MWNTILAITLCFLLLFFMSRLLMAMCLRKFIKNRQHIEKRKKGQSFWSWLTYQSFWDVIPKTEPAFLLYCFNFILFLLLLIVTFILDATQSLQEVNKMICSVQFVVIGGGITVRFASLGGYRKK